MFDNLILDQLFILESINIIAVAILLRKRKVKKASHVTNSFKKSRDNEKPLLCFLFFHFFLYLVALMSEIPSNKEAISVDFLKKDLPNVFINKSKTIPTKVFKAVLKKRCMFISFFSNIIDELSSDEEVDNLMKKLIKSNTITIERNNRNQNIVKR